MLAGLEGSFSYWKPRSLGLGSSQTLVISEYFGFFENTFLIRLLPPWYTNVKKRIIKSPKVYVRDSGILHHILQITSFDQLLSHFISGLSWEGFVIEQVVSIYQNQHEYYFYRTQDGTECDLVIVKQGKPFISVEIKSSEKPQVTKSFINSIQDLDTEHNFIIIPNCSESYFIDQKRNIQVASLYDFCKKIYPGLA